MIRRLLRGKSSKPPEDLSSNIDAKAIEQFQQGNYAEAETLWCQSLEIVKKSFGEGHHEYAKRMGALGEILTARGNYIGAERLFLKSYESLVKNLGEEHKDVGICLQNLGGLLYSKGDYAGAEPYFRKALVILEKQLGEENYCIADVTNNLAGALQMLGRYADAERLYSRSLKICEKHFGPVHPEVAVTLGNIAGLSINFGNYAEAESLYRRSLKINQESLGDYHPTVADCMFELANLLALKGCPKEAATLFERSLEISHNLMGADHPHEIRKQSRFAGILHRLGENEEAERLYRQTLAIKKKKFGPDSLDVAFTLNGLSVVLFALGNYEEAEALNVRGLGILEERIGTKHHNVALSLMCLSKIFDKTNRTPSAILCAKRAVNIFQNVRHDVNDIGSALNSYDISLGSYYEHLANILIKEGRLLEAEFVMGMLKDKDFQELIRSDLNLESKSVLFNPTEAPLIENYDKISLDLYGVGEETRILRQIENRTPEQNQNLAEAEECLYNKKNELSKFFQDISHKLPTSYVVELDQNKYKTIDLSGTPPHTVAIVTNMSENTFNAIMVTQHGRKSFSSEHKAVELSKKILKLRETLGHAEGDEYLPLAQELYNIVVKPLESELLENRAETIIWMLDSALRLLPLSALHDGKQFMLEKFSNVSITTASKNKAVEREPWNGLGMGTSKGHGSHDQLAAVQDELRGIIDQEDSKGIIPGKILLDESFTRQAMQQSLEEEYKAVHFASHFVLNPVDETMSYLLLGDGSTIRMDELRDLSQLFKGVDLVSFSACSTGLGTTSTIGREVDGIGYLGELQGAKTVLATLWPVEDISTSMLMREFYRTREGGITKAKALRNAQLALLNGSVMSEEGHDFTHPFFWSPFILIGNGC